MEENLPKSNSSLNLNKGKDDIIEHSKSKRTVTIKEDLEYLNDPGAKDKYDGLTDAEEERTTGHFSKGDATKEPSEIKTDNLAEVAPLPALKHEGNSDLNSDDSLSSKESNFDDENESSESNYSTAFYFNRGQKEKFDIRELQPMETLSWLKNHGLNKVAFSISKERENKQAEKVRDETIMELYNSDLKNFDRGYLKTLFLASLDRNINKINFEDKNSNEEGTPELKVEKDNFAYEPRRMLPVENNLQSNVNNEYQKKKLVKPKLISRLEITEEGISGENALAFQKYIRDLQEEVKMKDEKLKLREMERDNARLTREQLTRAVKSSLEIGSGAGKLDNLIKSIIKRSKIYAFRLLQFQARLKLKGKLGSEIFAGAHIIKHLALKRVKYGFSQLCKYTIAKKDEIFWKKGIVNNEGVASYIISMFKSILSCYKLACIVKHNHISAIKKFLYIWIRCSNLKNENANGISMLGAYNRLNGNSTLRELKIATETEAKHLSSMDKKRLKNGRKGFFSEADIAMIKSSSNLLGENLSSKEILRNIDDILSFVPNEKLNRLEILMNINQQQRDIDIYRNIALSHLSKIIKSTEEQNIKEEPVRKDALDKINDLNNDFKDKLFSSFENLLFRKDKLDILDEIKNHANDKFKQPINVPEWISERHYKLLEDFYSNPFYSIFVNEYNKRIFMDNIESDEEYELEDYKPEIDEFETESEYDVYYYSKDCPETRPLTIEKQLKNNVEIDPEKHDLELVKTDNLFIRDEADQFETVYYIDGNYVQDIGPYGSENQVFYVNQLGDDGQSIQETPNQAIEAYNKGIDIDYIAPTEEYPSEAVEDARDPLFNTENYLEVTNYDAGEINEEGQIYEETNEFNEQANYLESNQQ
ncbi:PH domain protein [Cryptosporidium felis]|nr:PH domain protein [Cryptosporidium felis]